MGVVVAAFVILAWLGSLVACLEVGVRAFHPAVLVLVVLGRAFLSTGLFITAHDAIHRAVSGRAKVDDAIGRIACFLFAAMSYRRLKANHALHHAAPTTDDDPDYVRGGYLSWLGRFFFRYATLYQLGMMALLYNLLHLRWDDASLWAFWAGPALLASVQLFTFGTYLPHRPARGPADALGPHQARSQTRGHLVAFVTCWFFGYHHEHHAAPRTPWFALWRAKRTPT